MAVKIGSARISESGTINGKKGDQKSGQEVSTQAWYKHAKGWYIARPKDSKKAEMIAKDMEYICANDHFGYGQTDRASSYTACKAVGWDASKVTVDVNTDCSKSVQICCLYAGIKVDSFSTLNELTKLEATGEFEIIKDASICDTSDYLQRGDILVTRTKGHTAVVLSNGAKVKAKESGKTMTVTTSGSALRLRKSAPSGTVITTMKNGSTVTATGRTESHSGTTWYEVAYKTLTGWASGRFLK